MAKTAVQKTPPAPAAITFKGKRTLVPRKVAQVAGSSNLVVVKAGEDLLKALLPRYEAMQVDSPRMEFYWTKVMTDGSYHETKEFPADTRMASKWELQEGANNIIAFRKKMIRIKTLIDHFKIGHDYELSVDEVVEIMT